MEFGRAMEKSAGVGIHSGSRNEKPQKTVAKISPMYLSANRKCPISSQSKSSRLQAQRILKPTRPQPFRFHTQERSTLSPKQVKVKDGEQNRKQEVKNTTSTLARPFRFRTTERSFLRAAKAGQSQQLKDKVLAVKKQDKAENEKLATRVAKIEPDKRVVEKEGIQGEDEVKKAYKATREETDEKAEIAAAKVFSALIERVEFILQKPEKESDDADTEFGQEVKKTYRAAGGEIDEKVEMAAASKVSSALIDTAESMPHKPRKETDDAEIGEEVKKAYRAAREETDEKAEMCAANALIDRVESMLQKPEKKAAAVEISDRLKIIDRRYDGKVPPEVVAVAAIYFKDIVGNEGAQELVSALSKDKVGKILVEDDVQLVTQTGDSEAVKIPLKESCLSTDGAKNVKERSIAIVPSFPEIGDGWKTLNRVDFVLQKLENETDDGDTEIDDCWKKLDRGDDGKVPPEELAAEAMYLEDTLELTSSLCKDKDGKILDGKILAGNVKLVTQFGDAKVVKLPLKGSFLSNKGAENMKERSISTVPSVPKLEYGGRLDRGQFCQVLLAGKKKIKQPDLGLLPFGLENQRCYCNNILQVLSFTPSLAELFLTQSHSISPIIRSKCGFCLLECPIRAWCNSRLLDLDGTEYSSLSSEMSWLAAIRAWSSLKLIDLDVDESETLLSAEEGCLVSSSDMSRFFAIRAWSNLKLLDLDDIESGILLSKSADKEYCSVPFVEKGAWIKKNFCTHADPICRAVMELPLNKTNANSTAIGSSFGAAIEPGVGRLSMNLSPQIANKIKESITKTNTLLATASKLKPRCARPATFGACFSTMSLSPCIASKVKEGIIETKTSGTATNMKAKCTSSAAFGACFSGINFLPQMGSKLKDGTMESGRSLATTIKLKPSKLKPKCARPANFGACFSTMSLSPCMASKVKEGIIETETSVGTASNMKAKCTGSATFGPCLSSLNFLPQISTKLKDCTMETGRSLATTSKLKPSKLKPKCARPANFGACFSSNFGACFSSC